MPSTYYATVRVKGTSTPQPVKVQANSAAEAKRLIQAQYGQNLRYTHGPSNPSKQPSWFK